MAAHQAPPSLGFSRQVSGLPFPSPAHESEKGKWSRSVVSDSSWPYGRQPTRLLHPWDSPGKSTGVGCHCLLCVLIKRQRVLNILGLAGHYNLCRNCSTLPLQRESSHGQNINECVWLGANETLFIKTGKSHIWAAGCNLPTSAYNTELQTVDR